MRTVENTHATPSKIKGRTRCAPLKPTVSQQKCLYGKEISADNLGWSIFIIPLLCPSDYPLLWVSADHDLWVLPNPFQGSKVIPNYFSRQFRLKYLSLQTQTHALKASNDSW